MTSTIETNESSKMHFPLLIICIITLYVIYYIYTNNIQKTSTSTTNSQIQTQECNMDTLTIITNQCDDNQRYNIDALTVISHQCNNDIDSISIATDQCDSDNQQCTPFKLPMTLNRNNPEFYQAFIQKLSNRTLASQCPRPNIRPVLLKCHQYRRKL